MAYRKLPRVTRQKISEYFEHRYQVKISEYLRKYLNMLRKYLNILRKYLNILTIDIR